MSGQEHRLFPLLIPISHHLFTSTNRRLSQISKSIRRHLKLKVSKRHILWIKHTTMFSNRCRILYSDSMFHLVGEHRHHLPILHWIGHVLKISSISHSISEDMIPELTRKNTENSIKKGLLSIRHLLRSIAQGIIRVEHSHFRFQPTI